MRDTDRTIPQAGPAFVFGVLVGVGLAVLATSPRSRRWMNERAEWARTDGKEALDNLRGHAQEGFEAVKGTARSMKGDVDNLRSKNKNNGRVSDDT